MPKSPKILIADDHPMLLKGFCEELASHGFTNLIMATNGSEALDLIINNTPEIAILDIEMPLLNGFEVINKCLEKGLKTKFIILTSHKEKRFIYRAKTLNLSGYLLKDEPFSEIRNCIEAISDGKTYFSSTFNSIFETQISPELQKLKLLSPSERTVIRMLARDKNSKEISEILLISIRTVQKHRSNILKKLDLETQQDALTIWVNRNKNLILSL